MSKGKFNWRNNSLTAKGRFTNRYVLYVGMAKMNGASNEELNSLKEAYAVIDKYCK